MRHDHDPLLCFHDRHLGYHLKLDAKCSVRLCTRQDELFAVRCAGLLWSLRALRWSSFGRSALCAGLLLVAPRFALVFFWSLRALRWSSFGRSALCAARRPAAQGRNFSFSYPALTPQRASAPRGRAGPLSAVPLRGTGIWMRRAVLRAAEPIPRASRKP
jgi:hypothetical protein